jgi:hypothetical protein
MGFWEFLNNNSNSLLLFANLALVIVTLIYVIFTKKTLDLSKRQLGLMQTPIIGMEIEEMHINRKQWGRDLQVVLKILNLGAVPALEINIDSEIKLKHSNIDSEKTIPSSTEPSFIPFLRTGAELSQESDFIAVTQFFDSDFVVHVLQEFKKQFELNTEKLKKFQEPEYDSVILCIYVYYKNNLNQCFISYFETYIVNDEPMRKYEFSDEQYITLKQIYFQKRKFYSEPIDEKEFCKDIEMRNKKRKKLQKII